MAKKKKTKYEGGDCYVNAFDYVLENPEWLLVHGVCICTGGPNVGKEFGHAWCEKGDVVFDAASGKEIPKVLYYAFGNVGYTVTYTKEQARKKAVTTGIYGAWDETVLEALHS
jgi:hypothetical protein